MALQHWLDRMFLENRKRLILGIFWKPWSDTNQFPCLFNIWESILAVLIYYILGHHCINVNWRYGGVCSNQILSKPTQHTIPIQI